MNNIKSIIISLVSSVLLTACASTQSPHPLDPYERTNRKIYRFNKAFDATMVRPVAQFYDAVIPSPVQKGVGNIFQNLQMLPTIANDVLQLHPVKAYLDFWRLFINSSFGIAGIFEVADGWGLPYRPNDFGMTMMHWGNNHSPYLVIPFWGPSTFRDAFGITYDYFLFSIFPHINPQGSLYGTLLLDVIDQRAQLMAKEKLLGEALDEYTLVRDAYLQLRVHHQQPVDTSSDPALVNTNQTSGLPSTSIDGANAYGYVDE